MTFWSVSLQALPARFRKPRLLIVGCGDVGQRVASILNAYKSAQGQALPRTFRILALTSSAERIVPFRAQGIVPLLGNLDDAASFQRLAGLATHVLHLAPPPSEGWSDPRTLALTRALRLRTAPSAFVYGSTSGVYGDLAGGKAKETLPTAARTPRAQRRVSAEQTVRFLGKSTSKTSINSSFIRTSILRIPGIYAPNREGGTPKDRLLKGTPVLAAKDDVYTNHIHADDLARACLAALWRSKPQRVYNVNDDSRLKMGDYFDFAADLYGLPRPPRVPRSTAQDQLPLMLLSFMSESRQMDNGRMKRELRFKLQYPTVKTGLSESAQPRLL
jgi:nucleoside-diphosphate-sugar epimerase